MKFYRVNALLLKFWFITRNSLDRVFEIVYWPFIGLLIWGFTANYVLDISSHPQVLNVLLGGAVLWTFYQRAMQDIGVYILEDFWSRNVTNLLATPMRLSEFVTSIFAFGLVRSILTFSFLAFLAFIFYSFNVFSAGIFAVAVFSIVLLLLGWFFGIFVAGLIFRYGLRIQVFAWSFSFLIQPFSAVFYPLSTLPAWLQNICLMIPSTYAFEGMRHAFSTGDILWGHFGIAIVLDLVLLAVGYWFFGKCIRSAKRTGILTKLE
ncbi:hypothetical protein GF345_06735 [Candidatus Woesearchaeota archaeon]|nr:hypothetical protein [Candidatus Woesearchaeota archaeon]